MEVKWRRDSTPA